jgi:pyridoxamine--pyruvate transaminase
MKPVQYTLTAGPSMVSPRVERATGSPMMFDYDPLFLERFSAVEDKVRAIFQTQGDVVLVQGEATLGLEAAVRGVVNSDTRCLNLVSGIYGRLIGRWLRELAGSVREIETSYRDVIDPADVERVLRSDGPFDVVSLVYTETPAGTRNPLSDIGLLAHEHGALVVTDAFSALCSEVLLPDDWHLDICVAASQKCLGGPPGIGLLTVSDSAWHRMRRNDSAPRNSYLSLLDWKEKWID